MICLNCGGPSHYYDIDAGELMLLLTECFAGQPLDPVPVAGPLDLPFGYGQAQSRVVSVVGSGQYGQVAIRRFGRSGENLAERRCGGQAARFGKPVARIRQGFRR